ncbi:MAG: beta strand repeat-containing protein, partial [Polymorphobacter sp.]
GAIAATANASGGAAGTGGGGVAGTAGGGEALAVAAAHSVPGAVSRLTAGTTTLTSLALGSATQRGRALVFAAAGDLTLASADLVVSGAAPGRLPSRSGLMAAVGTVAITGNATIAGSGNVVLGADAGAIAVGGTLTATAGLGIVDTIFTTPPATAGSIAVGTGRISAAGDITLSAPVTAAADLTFAGGNTVSLGNVTAAASLVISGPERITTGALRAGTGADLAGGAVTTAAITTGSGLTRIAASGNLVAGAIAAGGDVSIRAGGGVTVAAVTTPGKLGVVARGGSLVTGAIEAGPVAALLARGSVETGPISTGRTGTVFIGDAGQAGLITDDGKGGQEYTALLAAAPTALPGDVRIAGAVTTGQFQLAATGLARISGTLDTATLADIGGGTVQLGLLRSGGDVRLGAAAALSADGVQAGGAVLARGNGLTLGAVTAAGAIELVSDAAMTLGAVRGDGTIELDSGGTIRATTISAGNSLLISIDAAPGTPADIITAALDAGITAASTDPQAGYQIGLINSGGNITTGAIAARGNVGLLSRQGIITTGAVATDRDFAALARTGITTGGLKVGGSITLADAAMAALVPTDISPLAPPTGFDLTPLQLAAKPSRLAGNISVGGPVVSGSLRAAASGTVTLAGITTKGDLQLDAGRLALADLAAGGNLLLAADAPLVIGAASAGGDIAIAGAGDVSTGALRAGGSARITAQRLGTGAIRAGNDIDLASTGDLTTAALSAGDSVFLRAAASAQGRPLVTTDAIDAGTLNAFNGPGSARSVYIESAGNAALGTITSAGAIGVTARGAGLTTGALEAATAVVLLGGQAVSTGAISTPLPGSVYLASERQASLIAFDAAGNPDYTALLAARPIRLAGDLTINGPVTTGLFKAAATGTVRVGTLAAGRDISVDGAALALAGITAGSNLALISDTTLTLGDARANGDIDLTSGGRLVAGSLSAGDSVDLVGAGVTAAAISAGITAASGDPLAQYGVGVRSTGAIDVGAVAARGPVGLVAQGSSISVGAITAGESLALLARSGVTVGSIRTSAGGLTLVAADTMEALVTETANGNADYTALASAAPVALAGPVVLGGSIDTGTLRIAATGAVTGS